MDSDIKGDFEPCPQVQKTTERTCQSMTVSIRVTAAVKTQREYKAVAGCSGLELPKAQGDARLEYRVAQSSEGSC